MLGSRLSIAIVSGAIAPYSNRLYNTLAEAHGLDLHVFTCTGLEPQRKWRIAPATNYTLKVLSGLRYHIDDMRHVYVNPSVLGHLRRLRPSAVILGSFSPTMMAAAAYALATRTPLGISTDGSMETDPGKTSAIHRWVRDALIPRAAFGIGASEASLKLLEHYGLPPDKGHIVPLIPAWDAPDVIPTFEQRPFDVLFCGSLDEQRKGALFFGDVLIACKARGLTLRARIAGDGPDRQELASRLQAHGIPAQFDGYLQPEQLPEAFSSAKLFMFPSRADPWGLVANEAVLCGTPVLCTPHAVSSIEMVDRFKVGWMGPLDVAAWSSATLDILGNRTQWEALQSNRTAALETFSLDRAIRSYRDVLDDIELAAKRGARKPGTKTRHDELTRRT
jgi:glycosyltransferase involved in cell wall biosynthesis